MKTYKGIRGYSVSIPGWAEAHAIINHVSAAKAKAAYVGCLSGAYPNAEREAWRSVRCISLRKPFTPPGLEDAIFKAGTQVRFRGRLGWIDRADSYLRVIFRDGSTAWISRCDVEIGWPAEEIC